MFSNGTDKAATLFLLLSMFDSMSTHTAHILSKCFGKQGNKVTTLYHTGTRAGPYVHTALVCFQQIIFKNRLCMQHRWAWDVPCNAIQSNKAKFKSGAFSTTDSRKSSARVRIAWALANWRHSWMRKKTRSEAQSHDRGASVKAPGNHSTKVLHSTVKTP